MFNLFEKLFDKLDRGLSPKEKVVLVGILLFISAVGIILAIRYYTYIQKNPEFCNSCHLMEEAYTAWQKSGHRFIVCQDCHQLGIIEQNRLLIKFVFSTDRKTPEPHGNVTPWSGLRYQIDRPRTSYKCREASVHGLPYAVGPRIPS
jgi:hypothetical protein